MNSTEGPSGRSEDAILTVALLLILTAPQIAWFITATNPDSYQEGMYLCLIGVILTMAYYVPERSILFRAINEIVLVFGIPRKRYTILILAFGVSAIGIAKFFTLK